MTRKIHKLSTAVLAFLVAQPFADSHAQSVPAGVDIVRGQQIYQRFCALCHGTQLEGQPSWRKRGPDGKLPAPPHDENGHTWHHPDDVLFAITKHGMVPPNAPPDYASDMPAWGGTLSDQDIWNVLAYIKSQWPQRQRDYQAEITQRARAQPPPQ